MSKQAAKKLPPAHERQRWCTFAQVSLPTMNKYLRGDETVRPVCRTAIAATLVTLGRGDLVWGK